MVGCNLSKMFFNTYWRGGVPGDVVSLKYFYYQVGRGEVPGDEVSPKYSLLPLGEGGSTRGDAIGPKFIFSTSWGWGGVKGDVENYRTCCGLMRRKGYCITKTDSCGCCRPLFWGAECDEARQGRIG